MKYSKYYVAPLWPPLALLLATNLVSLLLPLPVLLQLLLNAGLSVHLGTLLGSALTKASYQEVKDCQNSMLQGGREEQGISYLWQILQYPLLGCFVLLGLYFVLKNAQKVAFDTVLNLAFVVLVVLYCSPKLHGWLVLGMELCELELRMGHKLWGLFQTVSKYLFSPLLALLLALLYLSDKHWLLNNLFALFFTVTAIQHASLRSFTLALPVLWTLFFYDLYWVYQSEVMVTVARGVDLPLKLQFPYSTLTGQVQLSMLGLGDIVIPGMYLALCFKYDIDNLVVRRSSYGLSQFGMKMYNLAYGLYLLGLGCTYLALYVFEHPQPALVFIVPCLSLSVVANLCWKGRIPMKKYNTSAMARSEDSLPV